MLHRTLGIRQVQCKVEDGCEPSVYITQLVLNLPMICTACSDSALSLFSVSDYCTTAINSAITVVTLREYILLNKHSFHGQVLA